MKKLILRAVPAVLFGVAALGCQEKPALNFSEYGETIPCLPRVDDLHETLPLPAEIETRECHIAERAIDNARMKAKENAEKLDEIEKNRAR